MPPGQYAYPRLAGCAHGSRASSGITRVLDEDGQSLPHALNARWHFAQLDTNSGRLALGALPQCNDAPAVQVVLQSSLETGLRVPGQSAGDTAASCSLTMTHRQHPE